MRALFVSGTDTGVGKTGVARGLAGALRDAAEDVSAIKPVETGFEHLEPSDAATLARACGKPALAEAAGLYRARTPVSPRAAALLGEPECPTPQALAATLESLVGDSLGLIEGAGGVLVPLDAKHTMLDLVRALDATVILVARNRLGCVSQTLCAAEAVVVRGLRLGAVVLSAHPNDAQDASFSTNAIQLRERLGAPVFELATVNSDEDAAWSAAVSSSGLLEWAMENKNHF